MKLCYAKGKVYWTPKRLTLNLPDRPGIYRWLKFNFSFRGMKSGDRKD